MKNIRVVNVTHARIKAVRVTPVKIARNGMRCTAKNASEDTTLSRSSGLRRVAAGESEGEGVSRTGSFAWTARSGSDWFTRLLQLPDVSRGLRTARLFGQARRE